MKKLEAFFLVVCILLGAFSLSAPVGAQNIQQHNWNYVMVEKNGTVKEIPLRTALTVPEINPVGENIPKTNEFQPLSEPSKSIDGNLDDWSEDELVAVENNNNYPGANLEKLYVSADENYLYIAIKTVNNESWDVTYEIALDFFDEIGAQHDWWRKVGFSEYKPDFGLYLKWNNESNVITILRFANYNMRFWVRNPSFPYAYRGNEHGLQTLEIAIPWCELSGVHPKLRIMAWISGKDYGSSAVESLPDDPAVHDSDDEWDDYDELTEFANVELSIPGVEVWDENRTQVGGEIYVDHPIIVSGHVELDNVSMIFNGTWEESLIQVDGSLELIGCNISGNNVGRIINFGELTAIDSYIADVDEINLIGESTFVGNSFVWNEWRWGPIEIRRNIGSITFRNNYFYNRDRIFDGSWGLKNVTLINNTFVTYWGVGWFRGQNIVIANNTIRAPEGTGHYDHENAFEVGGENVTIVGNRMEFGGLGIDYVEEPESWDVRDNYVDDLPIVFIKNENNAGISGTFAQVILVNSENFSITNSDISKETERTILVNYGIQVIDSRNVAIEGNEITAEWSGVYIEDSEDITVRENGIHIPDNWRGGNVGSVVIRYSKFVTMRNNRLTGTVKVWGWDIEHWITHDIDTTNYIGNRSILFLKNVKGVIVDRPYAQVILANVSNVIVRGISWNRNGNNYDESIQVAYSSNITLENLNINAWWGLRLEPRKVTGLTIKNSVIEGWSYIDGWDDLEGLVIQKNRFESLDIWGGVENALMEGNGFAEGDDYDFDVINSTIRDNYFHSENRWSGIWLYGTGNTFENNTIEGYGTGIYLRGSGNVIRSNAIKNNHYGIYVIPWADNNLIYNNFFNNTINAYIEPGSVNFWNTTVGNYWSDYTGNDLNGDGIGDTPYIIDENNIDYLPLMSWGTHPVSSDAVIIIDNETVRLNATKAIALKLHYIKDTKLGALQFNLTFDPELIKVENVTPGNAAEGSFISANINNSAGRVTVGIVNLNGLNEGIILKVTVKGISTGETELHGIPIDASDTNANPLRVTFTSGIIKVVKRPRGDINGDNRVTAVDALLYLRYAVGLSIDPYTIDPTYDDLNNDGKITATDALIALRIAVGLEKLS